MSRRVYHLGSLFLLLILTFSVVLPATPRTFATARYTAEAELVVQEDTLQAVTLAPPMQASSIALTCDLYPIALHAQSVAGASVGALLPDIYNGAQPGNFGWLSWAGNTSEATLVTSLTPPGDAVTYSNPDNAADKHLSVGDWATGRPGVRNSAAVRDALNRLKTIDISVPVWDVARASGSTSAYHVVDVAVVRIVDYALVGQDKFVSARFLGYNPACSRTPAPTVTATTAPSMTPSPTATAPATSTPATPTQMLVPTTTPSPTTLPTSEPSATTTAIPTMPSTPTLTATSIVPTSTSTPIPAATNTPTRTAVPTAQPTETPTPTIVPVNQRPVVDAGPDQMINISSSAASLTGVVQDDGLPMPATVTFSWSVVAGPGTVIFRELHAVSTTVQFSTDGVFQLRLTATDGTLEASDDMVVAVVGDNAAPVVNVGPDRTLNSVHILLPVGGDVRDDGLPLNGALSLGWQQLTGPAPVTFSTATSTHTTARFSLPGTYRLRLTATDSELSGHDELTITVTAPTTATTTPTATNAPATPTLPAATPTMTEILNSDRSPRGYYNAALGTILDGTQPQFPLANVAGGDPVINPAAEPDLTAADAILGDWLAADPLPLNSHWSPFEVVPAEWATNTENAVVFPVDAGPYGVANLRGSFGADNGIFVWVNGVYQFGAVEPRGAYRYEYADINLGSLHPGINYIQILREDHGGWTESILNIQGIVLTAPPVAPSTPTPIPTTSSTPAPTATPVADVPLAMPGWIGSPVNQSTVTGQVDIHVIDGMTLTDGKIDYWPVDRPDTVKTLAANISGTSATPLTTLDTTTLANGSYIIRVSGTAGDGTMLESGILVTVSGAYKPGRVRFSVTDLTVPVAGMPITVGRTYDSLERDRSGDFGYGWTLSVGSPRLDVDPAHNVTLTQPDGQRVTFYFTPHSYGGIFKAFLQAAYTPGAGVYGTLEANGCPILSMSGAGFLCFLDTADYQPTTYTYTDPYGRVFTMDDDGSLTSIADLDNNRLIFSRDGIASTNDARAVTFVRDAQYGDRITAIQVKDATGTVVRQYMYDYSVVSDLERVTLPASQRGEQQPTIQYVYDPVHPHLYHGTKAPLGFFTETTTYYSSPGDPAALDGRLKAVTHHVDASTSYTTSYVYDLALQMVTVTNPDGGQVVNHYTEQTVRQGTTTGTEIKLTSQTVDVRVVDGQIQPQTTGYTYDTNLNLVAIGLPDPNTGLAAPASTNPTTCASRNICYVYDTRGNQTQMTDSAGRTTVTVYNERNQPDHEIDPLNHIRAYHYDQHGNISSISDALGTMGGYASYDDHGSPLSRYLGQDSSKATTYIYDQYGNVQQTTDPLGNVTRYEAYDTFGNVGKITEAAADGPSHTTTFLYDDLARVSHVTRLDDSGQGLTTSYTYDLNGNQIIVKDETTGWSTEHDYYYNQLPRTTTFADGSSVSYTYTWRGEPATVTDQAGHVTRYSYDLVGELVAVTQAVGTPEAATELYSYDLAGRRVRTTDANGHSKQYRYDAGDRVRFVADPVHGSSHQTEYRYDDAGHLALMIDVAGTQTRYDYDVRGFLTDVTYAYGTPAARSERYEHDGIGNVTKHVDRNGKATTYTYDDGNRLLSVTNPMSQQTVYTLDRFGHVLTITDANQQQTTFAYDALGRPTKKIWPDQSEERYTYAFQIGATPETTYQKVNHHLTDGHTNVSSFDFQGRLTQIQYYDGQTVTYTYTDAGNLQDVRDQRGLTCYDYDALDRLTRVQQLGTGTASVCGQSSSQRHIAYAYDASGNRTAVNATVGATTRTTSYAYDANNRLCSITPTSAPTPCGVLNDTTYTYSYDDLARTQTLTYPNGVITTASYDQLYHLTNLTQRFNTQTLASYTYTVDGVGNRTRLEEADGSVTTWTYDDAYRLRREQREAGDSQSPATASWDHRFTYDAVGNRMSLTDVIGVTTAVTTYTYRPNKLDQLAVITLPNGTQLAYDYDERGNLKGDGRARYSYDAADRLSSVTSSGHREEYAYDADGRRISRTIDGVATAYLWDEGSTYGDVLADINSRGTMETHYVLGGATVLGQVRDGVTHYLLHDGQGSTRTLVDPNGAVREQYLYDAFGQLRRSETTPQTSYLYTGQQFDEGTGFYYLRARSYNPADGRFLSRDTFYADPNDPSELNRYGYTANNPINAFDPSGHMAVEYTGANKENEEQAAARARYINGYTVATGPAKWGLLTQSMLSMLVDTLIVESIHTQLPEYAQNIAVGLGTVYHLQTDTQTKAFTIAGSFWPKLGKATGGEPFSWLGAFTSNIRGPGITIRFITEDVSNSFDDWFKQSAHDWHAEMIVARWALKHYGAYPTPHRVLDIATTIRACIPSGWGDRACNLQLPVLWELHPLLFETTLFPMMR